MQKQHIWRLLILKFPSLVFPSGRLFPFSNYTCQAWQNVCRSNACVLVSFDRCVPRQPAMSLCNCRSYRFFCTLLLSERKVPSLVTSPVKPLRWSRGSVLTRWYPSSRVQTRPKLLDFSWRKNPQHTFLRRSKAVCPMS